MRTALWIWMLCLTACGGVDFTGAWTGTISTASGASYQDTWSISNAAGKPSELQILSTGTCTQWLATEGNGIATWNSICGPYLFSGSIQEHGSSIEVGFSLADTSSTGGRQDFSGSLSRR